MIVSFENRITRLVTSSVAAVDIAVLTGVSYQMPVTNISRKGRQTFGDYCLDNQPEIIVLTQLRSSLRVQRCSAHEFGIGIYRDKKRKEIHKTLDNL